MNHSGVSLGRKSTTTSARKRPFKSKVKNLDFKMGQPHYLQSSCFLHQNKDLCQRPSSSLPTPLTLTSPVGDGKPQGTESQQKELGLKNSHEVHKNAEVLPQKKPDCQLEKKKVGVSKSIYP